MSALGTKLRSLEGDRIAFWCPGCDDSHVITIVDKKGWTYNGDPNAPTFTPSVKVTGVQWAPGEYFHMPTHAKVPTGGQTICHSYVRGGKIQFLDDCTHNLVGQTVPLPDFPI